MGKNPTDPPSSSPIITPKWLRRPVCFNLIRAPAAINKLRTPKGVRGTEGGNCCATVRTYLKHCEAKVENGSTQSKCLRPYICVIKHGKRVGAIIEGTHTPLNHPWLFMVGALLTRMVVVVEWLGARGWGVGLMKPHSIKSFVVFMFIWHWLLQKKKKKKRNFLQPPFTPGPAHVFPDWLPLCPRLPYYRSCAPIWPHKHEDTVTLGQHRTNSIASLPHDTAL